MSAPQTDAAREQARQDNGQFGTQPKGEGAVTDLVPPRPLDGFIEGEGVCWRNTDGHLYGAIVVKDDVTPDAYAADDVIHVARPSRPDEVIPVRRDQLTAVRPMEGTPTPIDEIEQGDWVLYDGQITEVGEVGVDPEDDDEDRDPDAISIYFSDLDATDTFGTAELLPVVDGGDRYITAEEGMARNPHRTSGAAFSGYFQPVHNPETNSEIFEDVPDDVPVERVWTQVENPTDDGRYDYALLPGIHRVNAMNYVITEHAWKPENADDPSFEIDWN